MWELDNDSTTQLVSYSGTVLAITIIEEIECYNSQTSHVLLAHMICSVNVIERNTVYPGMRNAFNRLWRWNSSMRVQFWIDNLISQIYKVCFMKYSLKWNILNNHILFYKCDMCWLISANFKTHFISNHHPGRHLQRNFDWDKAWWGETEDPTYNVKFHHSSHHISLILMPTEGSRLNISLIKYAGDFRAETIYFIGSWHHYMLLPATKCQWSEG